MLKISKNYFSKAEIALWGFSSGLILLSFLIFDRENHLTLAASLIGTTSLIFNAKGNPLGQFLMIIFSLLYGIISYSFSYFGEMLTYLGMTMPMAAFTLYTWLKNPYIKGRAEVLISSMSKKEVVFMFIFAAAVTFVFYFILEFFNTANLFFSTVSVTTSFLAVYLTFRRNPAFAIAYAANDVVLIILWTFASLSDSKYISVIVCFITFLFNDIYGYINWKKMKLKQKRGE